MLLLDIISEWYITYWSLTRYKSEKKATNTIGIIFLGLVFFATLQNISPVLLIGRAIMLFTVAALYFFTRQSGDSKISLSLLYEQAKLGIMTTYYTAQSLSLFYL